jgi:hypothetical protein
MDLNDILAQFGAGKKNLVYLSITPGIGVELIELDTYAKVVKNYSYKPLEYNESLREISSMEMFKSAVSELFEELNINTKSNVVLNIPLVLLGAKELPLLLADDAVTEALTSEVEQSYIFKRYEPAVSWVDASTNQNGDMRKLFYSAVQKNVIDDLKNTLNELGATLVGVETSITSILKALIFSGLVENQVKDNVSWNLMTITQNGYSICSMVGKNLVDYYEEPLAIKSFEGEEIYNAINASAQITLMSYPANSLFVVSETDVVSAELLTSKMVVDCPVTFLENNSYKKQDVIPTSLEILEEVANKVSLEAIGVATGNSVSLPVAFDFIKNSAGGESGVENLDEPVHVVLGSTEFDISPNNARNIALIFALIIIIPVLLVFLAVPMVTKKKQAQLDDINAQLQQVEAEVKKLEDEQNKSGTFDVNAEIKRVLGTNRSKIMSYTALGESVPKKLWLTYFVAKDDGKLDIKGEAANVEAVYTFYKNMKDSLIDTKLKLHKLEMKSKSVDDAVTIDPNASSDYEFEITNMTDNELNPPAQSADDANQQQQQDNAQNNNQNDGAMQSKPLLNLGKNK